MSGAAQRLDNTKSVLVAGGGLAGMAAALALAKHGANVQLLEARRTLGGRTGSFVLSDDRPGPSMAEAVGNESESVDYCQHVGMGCCTNLKQFIAWLGQTECWQEQRQLHFYGPTGRYRRLAALPLLPAPLHLMHWLTMWPGLSWRDRLSVARGLLALGRLPLHGPATGQWAIDWLRTAGQTAGAIDHFWRTILVSALGEQLERVSLAAAAQVLQVGFLGHRQAFHLLVPTQPLGELFGRRAGEQLSQAGVDVRLGTAIDAIRPGVDGRPAVRSGGRWQEADSLLLALPWHQLGRLELPGGGSALAAVAQRGLQLQSSPISGIHTWWDRPWLPQAHAALVGRFCQWVFPRPQSGGAEGRAPAAVAGGRGHYYQIVVSASRQLPPGDSAALQSLLVQDLGPVFPLLKQAQLIRHKTVTDPRAVFSVSPDALEYRPDSRIADNLVLAGDWTNTGWPATMEGAILSGFRAAETVLGGWQRPVRIVCPPLGTTRSADA